MTAIGSESGAGLLTPPGYLTEGLSRSERSRAAGIPWKPRHALIAGDLAVRLSGGVGRPAPNIEFDGKERDNVLHGCRFFGRSTLGLDSNLGSKWLHGFQVHPGRSPCLQRLDFGFDRGDRLGRGEDLERRLGDEATVDG